MRQIGKTLALTYCPSYGKGKANLVTSLIQSYKFPLICNPPEKYIFEKILLRLQ